MTDDKARSYPLLPKLNKNLTVQLANQGCWIREGHDFLNSLTESIDSGTEVANLGHIDSIPDVWARPLLFQMALFDEDNKIGFVSGLHKQVVGEWRSLIAMIALKDIKHLNLTTREVCIDSINGGTIEKVLDVLKPKEAILKDDEYGINPWSRLYIFYLDGRILAVTSPTTLLATAADYENTFAGMLQEPWSSNGIFLTDPVGRLSDEEHFALFNWLDAMHDKVQKHGLEVSRGAVSGDETVIKGLLRMLATYRNDVGQRCHQLSFESKVDFVDAGLELNNGIFRWMNYTAKAKAATSQSSAFKLKISEARKVDKDILIVSPDMAKSFANTLGVHPAKLPVWAGISANDLTEEDLGYGAGRIGRTPLNGAEFRRPEDLFTDKIVMLNGGKLICSMAIPGIAEMENSKPSYTPIIPLKAEILDYFTPGEIADALYIERKGDNIYVNFTYHLVQGDYKYTKVYERNDTEYINQDVPVIEIWPNIKREGWNKYYLYYENVEAQSTEDKLCTEQFFINPWSYDRKLSVPAGGLLNKYTARLDIFPEVLCCKANTKESGLFEAGIVLMKQPTAFSRSAGKKWSVGIDFGTSSTMVYYRENEEAATPFTFTSNAYHITASDLTLGYTTLNFIPIPCKYDDEEFFGSKNMPDGSTISAYRIIENKSKISEIKPLEEGCIAWVTGESALRAYFGGNNNIDLNLKWQNDDRGLYEIAAYLKQLCMHIMAEAVYHSVNKISWNFSYPTAFSQTQKISFEGICREAVEDAVQNTGFDNSNDELSITSWPESKAASYHFNKVGNSFYNFSEGAICLDIGAGTTDISVISGAPGRIVYHTSLQYAGRYFFKPIASNMTLFGGESDLEINSSATSYAKNNATFDARMRDHSDDFLRDLKNIIGRDEVKAVLQQSQMAVSGLFYYLGELLAALKEKGVYTEDRLPDVYIGGNGSRIFSWLTGGRFEDSNNYLSIIKNILERKSGLPRDAAFRIYLSEKPKIEVVAGMIGDKPTNDREFFDEDKIADTLFGEAYDPRKAEAVMAGNDFVCHELPGYPDGFISAGDISDGIKVSELDEINSFVHMFNKGKYIWHEPISFSNSDMAHLLKNVNGYYVSQKGRDPKDIYVEPIFIIAMKQLIDMQVGR